MRLVQHPRRNGREPVRIEHVDPRGITFDPDFEEWANRIYSTEGAAAVSLKSFRYNLIIKVLNLQGVPVRAYRVFRAWVSEYTALPEMDAVTVHVAATPDTRGLCDAKFFAAMRPGAYFINTSRGELVDFTLRPDGCGCPPAST